MLCECCEISSASASALAEAATEAEAEAERHPPPLRKSTRLSTRLGAAACPCAKICDLSFWPLSKAKPKPSPFLWAQGCHPLVVVCVCRPLLPLPLLWASSSSCLSCLAFASFLDLRFGAFPCLPGFIFKRAIFNAQFGLFLTIFGQHLRAHFSHGFLPHFLPLFELLFGIFFGTSSTHHHRVPFIFFYVALGH